MSSADQVQVADKNEPHIRVWCSPEVPWSRVAAGDPDNPWQVQPFDPNVFRPGSKARGEHLCSDAGCQNEAIFMAVRLDRSPWALCNEHANHPIKGWSRYRKIRGGWAL
jgi:hypothetical protein